MNLVIVVSSKIDGDKGEPDDAGAVHGETDIFGLVEIFGYFPRFEGVKGAEDNEQHVVEEREHQRQVTDAAGEHGRQRLRVHFFGAGTFN